MESSQTYLKPQMLFPHLKEGKTKTISNLSKLMEKIVHPRLYTFFEENFLIFEQ